MAPVFADVLRVHPINGAVRFTDGYGFRARWQPRIRVPSGSLREVNNLDRGNFWRYLAPRLRMCPFGA